MRFRRWKSSQRRSRRSDRGRRIRRAQFESSETSRTSTFTSTPPSPKAKVIDLATCGFLARRHNVLLLGPAGVGKSHIAQAPGQRACLLGHKVLYTTAHDMLKQLRAARGDGSHDRLLLRFTNPALLILDDLGLRPLGRDETIDLYESIRLRYQRASTIVTSNRALDELPAIFGDPLRSSAAVDRLLHDAHVLIIEGDSYRNPPPSKRRSRRRPSKDESE